jgi:hypothetical protein
MGDKKIIMRESDEAASIKTVTGWVSSDGRWWGDNESTARYAGSTHSLCECGTVVDKGWTKCDKCRDKDRFEKYKTLQTKVWDGVEPLVLWDDDEFFFSDSDLMEYCEDQNMQPQDLQIVFAEPVYGRFIDDDYFCDELSEDGDLPDTIHAAMGVFNEVVKAAGPLSWRAGKIAAIVPEQYKIELEEKSEETA